MVVPGTHMKWTKMKDLSCYSFVRECPASLLVSLYCIFLKVEIGALCDYHCISTAEQLLEL